MTTRENMIDRLSHLLISMPNICAETINDTIEFLENEKTPEDLLSALAVVGDMDVSEQKHYFKIDMDLTCSFDALYLLAKGSTPDMIFDAVEKYKDEKYKEKMAALKMKVQRLADEIGLRNLKEFVSQIEEERKTNKEDPNV